MAKAKDSKAFTLADEIVTKYAATDPIVATMLGVPEYADRMPDFSTEMIATQAAIFADGVKQAQGIETFNEVDRIARDVIVDRAAALARIHESGEVARAFSVLSSPVG